jgi:hypothetical protein
LFNNVDFTTGEKLCQELFKKSLQKVAIVAIAANSCQTPLSVAKTTIMVYYIDCAFWENIVDGSYICAETL